MGAQNVAKVFVHWTDLGHRDARVLAFLALVSLDADSPPRFFDHWERVAEAIGNLPDRRDFATQDDYKKAMTSAKRQIEKSYQSLAEAGAIAYTGFAGRNTKAEYALSLDPHTGWVCKGMKRDPTDGRLKGDWEPIERDSARPKKSEEARPKRSEITDQKGREMPTKKVGPMSTQESTQEQGSRTRSPEAIKSPARPILEGELVEPDDEEDLVPPMTAQFAALFPDQRKTTDEMTCSECLRRRYRDDLTRTDVGRWICSSCLTPQLEEAK